MPLEFRCAKCGEIKDVRTLRKSLCPACIEGIESGAAAAAEAQAAQRARYEAALRRGPHYTGPVEAWTKNDPVLLPDAEHFVCPTCKQRKHLVHDLSYRWNKQPFPVPNKYTSCDACHRKETDDTAFERPAARNRFSRER
jgi:hypothetical protein